MLKKAAIGTGLPVGLAEDASEAALWLIHQGLDGVGAVLVAIEDGFNNPIKIKRVGNTRKFLEARVALCGPSGVDLLTGDTSVEVIHFCKVDSPLLLIGQAGIGAESFEIELTLGVSGGATASVSQKGLSLCGSTFNRGVDVHMKLCESNPIARVAKNRDIEIKVDLKNWQILETLAAMTYVPSNELSRMKGAGAGLIDNN